MVVKLSVAYCAAAFGFESRVILDGSQTGALIVCNEDGFESRVILDGSQTQVGIAQVGTAVWESCYFRW